MSKKSKGRQKVEMTKMPNESNLQVTFSKRRSGLFKKASELCILCGVEAAVIVFSPGKKVFSFGHPCVETVINNFITRTSSQPSGNTQFIEAHRGANIRELNIQLTQVLSHLEKERKRGEELNHMKKASQAQHWWESPIDELSLSQLDQLKAFLEELKKNIEKHAENIMIHNSNSSNTTARDEVTNLSEFVNPSFFFGGTSSNAGTSSFEDSKANIPKLNPQMMLNRYNNSGYGRGFF